MKVASVSRLGSDKYWSLRPPPPPAGSLKVQWHAMPVKSQCLFQLNDFNLRPRSKVSLRCSADNSAARSRLSPRHRCQRASESCLETSTMFIAGQNALYLMLGAT